MTHDVTIRAAGWTAALLSIVLAALSWMNAAPAPERTVAVTGLTAPDSAVKSTEGHEREAATIVARNPFRVSRTPTHVRFGSEPMPDMVSIEPQGEVARPVLRLAGIVGGPPWAVLIEGIPGHEGGVMLTQSEDIAGVLFRGIRGDTVILAAFDTIWHLTPTSRWQ